MYALYLLYTLVQVNLIYAHSSLGVNIKLSLVKLVLLEEETVSRSNNVYGYSTLKADNSRTLGEILIDLPPA